jgi:UDP-2,4-diacetamido-2,4,6-trideoxy-beta-L-altropyranose hydrolase
VGPTIVIRADASSRIGTGHVMRCLALAASAKNQGWQISLIGCVASNEMQSRVADMGIHFIPLENACPDSVDLEKTLELLACHSENGESRPYPPWLVLDGYQFDANYHEAVRGAGVRMLVVDDYNHLERYDCDILLNQNIGAERLDYQPATDTKRLLGSRFALLRPEFLPWKDKKTEVPEKARRILVTMGGADPDNATSKILEGLSLVGDTKIEVKVVVGPANPRLSEITLITEQASFQGEVLHGVRDMASIMAWADLAVTSASVTSLELAYMGVPMATVVLAENQEGLAAGLVERGAAIDLGSCDDLTPQQISQAVSSLLVDRIGRQAMSDAGQAMVDGRGAVRIVAVMGRDFLHLRKAEPGDSRRLWEWANDPVARSHSFNTDPIPWEEHQVWFHERLNDQDSCIYLAELPDGESVGTIRFQAMADHAVVSVTIDGDFRGLGFGAEVIRRGCLQYRGSHSDLPIRALIKPDNPASKLAFTKAGFKPDGEIENAGEGAMVMAYQADGR